MRSTGATLGLIAALAIALLVGADGPNRAGSIAHARIPPMESRMASFRADHHQHHRHRFAAERALDQARRFAERRAGIASFAVSDTEGRLRGRDEARRYPAASVVKAMLLAAELRRLKHAGEGVDDPTDALLTAMITASDNDAADAIYYRAGDAGLFAVARRAGMTGFTVAGHWGNAQITALDMARFFGDLDRMFPRRFRAYAKGLLGSIIPSESWGIPQAAGDRWAVRFKGGWLPDRALVHQAAELRSRHTARKLAVVVLTDSQPSFEYGIETIRGVVARLLAR